MTDRELRAMLATAPDSLTLGTVLDHFDATHRVRAVTLLLEESDKRIRSGDYDAAKARLDLAESIAPLPLMRVLVCSMLGNLEMLRRRHDAAQTAYTRGFELAGDAAGSMAVSILYWSQGNAYLRNRRPIEAIAACNRGLVYDDHAPALAEMARRKRDAVRQAEAIAWIWGQQHVRHIADSKLNGGLTLQVAPIEQVEQLQTDAMVLVGSGQLIAALDHFAKAARIAAQAGLPDVLVINHLFSAIVCMDAIGDALPDRLAQADIFLADADAIASRLDMPELHFEVVGRRCRLAYMRWRARPADGQRKSFATICCVCAKSCTGSIDLPSIDLPPCD